MDLIGIVLQEKVLTLMSAMKVKIICFGMKDKQLFYFTKWVDFLLYLFYIMVKFIFNISTKIIFYLFFKIINIIKILI